MFVGLGLSGIVPVIHGLSRDSYRHLDERMGLSWVLLEGVLYISGAFIYAVRSATFFSSSSRLAFKWKGRRKAR